MYPGVQRVQANDPGVCVCVSVWCLRVRCVCASVCEWCVCVVF
jgi:hypothetical protein